MFKHRSPVAEILALGANRVDARDVAMRLAERDQREAADTRTEAQRWLGDPPLSESALAQRRDTKPASRFRE
jgi:hypothetical protein